MARDTSEQTISETRQSYVSLGGCPTIAPELRWKTTSIINNSRTIGHLFGSTIIIQRLFSSSYSA